MVIYLTALAFSLIICDHEHFPCACWAPTEACSREILSTSSLCIVMGLFVVEFHELLLHLCWIVTLGVLYSLQVFPAVQ